MNKNSLNTEDLEVQLLAHLLAGDVENAFVSETVIDYGRQVLKEGSVSLHDATDYFMKLGFEEQTIADIMTRMRDNGVIEATGDLSPKIRFSQEMQELILSYNPQLEIFNNETKEKKMDNGNQQDSGNQGSIQKASDNQGQDKPARTRYDELVEKISTPENLELAKNLAAKEVNPMDEEVKLVRAIYDDNAEGVNFDTVSNKFDVRGERASLFVVLSKELSQRGVIDKFPGNNGDRYVVTMPFRQLMAKAQRGEGDRYEVGSANVSGENARGTQELVTGDQRPRSEQDRRDEANSNDRRTGQAADQYRNDTGRDLSQDLVEKRDPSGQSPSQQGSIVDTPMSIRDKQRDGGNVGSDTQGQRGTSEGGMGQGKPQGSVELGDDFKPDSAVLSVSIAVFGTPMTVDEVRDVSQAARSFLNFAERNPNVKPTFEKNGIVFGVERAQQFLKNAKFYGLGD